MDVTNYVGEPEGLLLRPLIDSWAHIKFAAVGLGSGCFPVSCEGHRLWVKAVGPKLDAILWKPVFRLQLKRGLVFE